MTSRILKRIIFYFSLLLLTLSLIAPPPANANSKYINKKKGGPIKITSKEMVSEKNGSHIIFSKDVITRRDNITIYSDTLDVFSDDKNEKILQIIAKGKVKINNNEKFAEGEKAIYYEEEQKIELTGNVKVWEKENVMKGKKIIFFLNDEKIKVLGDVNVIFYPEKKTSKK